MRKHTPILLAGLIGIAAMTAPFSASARDHGPYWNPPAQSWNHHKHHDRHWDRPFPRGPVYFHGAPAYYGYRGYSGYFVPTTYYRYPREPSVIIQLPPIIIR